MRYKMFTFIWTYNNGHMRLALISIIYDEIDSDINLTPITYDKS